MQVQKIFFKASESYGENGTFDLNPSELDFLLKRFNDLNQHNVMSTQQIMEAKAIISILLYADEENYLKDLKLTLIMQDIFKKVYNEFCEEEGS